MKKRVALAWAIILDSRILLCDEPTSGLDPLRIRDISDLIRDVARKLHCTTVVTSHDIKIRCALPTIWRFAERRIAAVGTPSEVKASNNVFVKEFIS